MILNDIAYKIAFASLKGLHIDHARELLDRVGSEELFFTLPEAELIHLTGIRSALFDEKTRFATLERAKAEATFITDNNIRPLYFTDNNYPHRLLECEDAPLIIFTVGDCNLNTVHIVSIVGTRHATNYGIGFTTRLVEELSKKIDNLIIVSGLAYGIDIAAHRAALANGVPTVAIMATGLSTIYPATHRKEAVEMARNGGMIATEYFHKAMITKANFLSRNRIVAGLADCVVVSESAVKGGAMVTGRIATDYGRDVFALPGRISDKYSGGCNRLIANCTAALIESADDLISAMKWVPTLQEGTQQTLDLELNEDEQIVVDCLRVNGDMQRNQLSIQTNIPVQKLAAMITDLEFREIVDCMPGGLIRLK